MSITCKLGAEIPVKFTSNSSCLGLCPEINNKEVCTVTK